MPRDASLAKIHIAKKALALDEDNYRAICLRITGKRSAKDMNLRQRTKLLHEFKRLGWKDKPSTFKKSSSRVVRKVFALWGELGRAGKLENSSREALRSFVKRMTGVDDSEWLTPEQASKVIEALKAMDGRAK